ncbi:erythromycin esterase family protein [Streptomyces sp. NPDC058000]|uniref:erythromycin esterase family protein n=1 Tax=Streptomyces sp. NPDC058000 TaxID=3346299 RepID=UPI0036EFB1CC
MTAEPTATPFRLSDEAVVPLQLDPTAPLDDLAWLDRAIGDARVVAIGESAHYHHESFLLRHRLCRYLVERHGFGAYALESGFVEGWQADAWVRGGDGRPDRAMADGLTSLMGLWTPQRAHLEWLRQHNRTAARPVGFYGIDLPGSMVSLLPGLDAVFAHLAEADPEFSPDPGLRQTAAGFAAASAFSAPAAMAAYKALAPEAKDALTAGLADLSARLTSRRLDHVRRTTAEAHDRALRSLRTTIALDAMLRELARGHHDGALHNREATLADTVEWILRREDRIVLAAHNGHVQRCPDNLPVVPPTTLGMHLADRLGDGYLAIGTTSATGRTLNTSPSFYTGTLFTDLEETPQPGSLDALMAARHHGPFATDLRRLPPADAAALRAVTQHRYGTFYADHNPLDAFDLLVHLPHATPADPDTDALTHAPDDIREAFARWRAM